MDEVQLDHVQSPIRHVEQLAGELLRAGFRHSAIVNHAAGKASGFRQSEDVPRNSGAPDCFTNAEKPEPGPFDSEILNAHEN